MEHGYQSMTQHTQILSTAIYGKQIENVFIVLLVIKEEIRLGLEMLRKMQLKLDFSREDPINLSDEVM